MGLVTWAVVVGDEPNPTTGGCNEGRKNMIISTLIIINCGRVKNGSAAFGNKSRDRQGDLLFPNPQSLLWVEEKSFYHQNSLTY